MASEVVTTFAGNGWSGISGIARLAACPGARPSAPVCGTRTYTRSLSACARWNNSLPPLPATMRSPTSTARMVTVPGKGATIFWKETNSCKRRMFARIASTLAAAVSRAAAFSAAACSDTDAVFSNSFQRLSVTSARCRLAWARTSCALACSSCWSKSGVSIVPSNWPAATCAPISATHSFRYPLARAKIDASSQGLTSAGNSKPA